MKSKLFKILLSAVAAFALWCFVIMVEQPESEKTYYDIPVVLLNENVLTERGLMIVSERPTVTLRLSATRTNLNNLNESNINVIANVASIAGIGTHEITYSISYPGNVPASAVTVKSQSTDMVKLKVEKRITKRVPIVPIYNGSVPEGMIADKENAVMDIEFIEVSGPEVVVEQITQAVIQVDLNDQTETLMGEFAYILCNDAFEPVDAARITTNAEVVNLTLKIHRVKEIALKVTVIPGGGATEATSSITIEHPTIRVSGSDALLEGLDELDLGTINLAELVNDTVLTYPINLPEGINNETGITETTVSVKFPNLRVRTLQITNIEAINVPKGMTVELITQSLQVSFRGPSAIVNAMTEKDILVTVDFTDAELGTDTKKATVTISSKYGGVGAVGSYSVAVTVKEAEE